MFDSIRNDDYNSFIFALKKEQNINKPNKHGKLILFHILYFINCKEKVLSYIKLLEEKKINFEVNTYNGINFFTMICKYGYVNVLKYLIGKNVDIIDNRPFNSACSHGHLSVIKYLESLVGITNKEMNTLLYIACDKGYLHIIKYLQSNGADIYNIDKYGNNLLDISCNSGNLQIVKYLIEFGVDINNKNNAGITPLITACKNNQESIIVYLENIGVNMEEKNKYGSTIFDIACYWGCENIIKYLIKIGIYNNNHYVKYWIKMYKKEVDELIKNIIIELLDNNQCEYNLFNIISTYLFKKCKFSRKKIKYKNTI